MDVERGSWIAVVGGNGSGKTTLLSVVGGALPLRSGSVERAGSVRSALLLQEPDNQFVATRVRHELALSIPVDVDATHRRTRIAGAVERFELGALLERNPHRLSGGEKQRLALATVWLEEPDVLLLDEPLAYLDRETGAQVVSFVRELNAQGAAVVWATPGDDVALAREAVVLEGGRVVFAGAASGCPVDAGEDDATARAADPGRRPDPRGRESCLRFDSVSFAYEKAPVLHDLNLDVARGECLGVTGRNSAGKSTLLLLAGGALEPASGRVHRDAERNGVLYLPQSPERLFFAETVLEEVCFGLERRGASRETARERASTALCDVSLDPGVFAARSPFQLSLGEMRRVAFAIAAALEPGLLLLDEPSSCLDRAGRGVLDALVRARLHAGASVIVASHEEAHLARVCDRVVAVVDGRVR
jgi:energy-coupling factor transport system ATP-binding protein